MLAVGNCCYVAVCSAAESASLSTGRRRVGHIVAAARLQLVIVVVVVVVVIVMLLLMMLWVCVNTLSHDEWYHCMSSFSSAESVSKFQRTPILKCTRRRNTWITAGKFHFVSTRRIGWEKGWKSWRQPSLRLCSRSSCVTSLYALKRVPFDFHAVTFNWPCRDVSRCAFLSGLPTNGRYWLHDSATERKKKRRRGCSLRQTWRLHWIDESLQATHQMGHQ